MLCILALVIVCLFALLALAVVQLIALQYFVTFQYFSAGRFSVARSNIVAYMEIMYAQSMVTIHAIIRGPLSIIGSMFQQTMETSKEYIRSNLSAR